jgi:hypothetical protein
VWGYLIFHKSFKLQITTFWNVASRLLKIDLSLVEVEAQGSHSSHFLTTGICGQGKAVEPDVSAPPKIVCSGNILAAVVHGLLMV